MFLYEALPVKSKDIVYFVKKLQKKAFARKSIMDWQKGEKTMQL